MPFTAVSYPSDGVIAELVFCDRCLAKWISSGEGANQTLRVESNVAGPCRSCEATRDTLDKLLDDAADRTAEFTRRIFGD